MPDTPLSVYVLRHGETAWSLTGQHTGTTDLPLTENGRAAARRLAPRLGRQAFPLVLTSPLQRARETCEPAGLGARAQVEPDLVEWNYGQHEGLTTREIHQDRPGWELFTDGCPGGEAPAQIGARVDRVLATIRGAHGNVAVFAHGHVLRVLVARWLDLPVAAGRLFLLDTGTLSILTVYRGQAVVQQWNAPAGP